MTKARRMSRRGRPEKLRTSPGRVTTATPAVAGLRGAMPREGCAGAMPARSASSLRARLPRRNEAARNLMRMPPQSMSKPRALRRRTTASGRRASSSRSDLAVQPHQLLRHLSKARPMATPRGPGVSGRTRASPGPRVAKAQWLEAHRLETGLMLRLAQTAHDGVPPPMCQGPTRRWSCSRQEPKDVLPWHSMPNTFSAHPARRSTPSWLRVLVGRPLWNTCFGSCWCRSCCWRAAGAVRGPAPLHRARR
jgi:hypothetical protein